MISLVEYISQPWSWYVSGIAITLVMFSLLYFGKQLGVSSNLRTMCSIAGAGRFSDFFDFKWQDQIWNLVFIVGAAIGGWISHNYLSTTDTIGISEVTKNQLLSLGLSSPGLGYIPEELIGWESLRTIRGWIFVVGGGILVGFGTRYAGGCTSGHAISGLSNLQIPSLIAVIGFFIGGLVMTHLILPHLLKL
jgi:uncharacterized membrane protein YedE/YeeE